MKALVILIISSVLLFGCATPYKTLGLMGGFSDTQLGENVFRVSFSGNAYTSRERVLDFTLLRASELCLERGFRYFIVAEVGEHEKSAAMISGNFVRKISKPTIENTIMAFREKPDAQGPIYDAEFVRNSIRTKYSIYD